MSKKYCELYRCRVCGLPYVKDVVSDKDEAENRLLHSLTKTDVHCCANGSLGIADLQGFKFI